MNVNDGNVRELTEAESKMTGKQLADEGLYRVPRKYLKLLKKRAPGMTPEDRTKMVKSARRKAKAARKARRCNRR